MNKAPAARSAGDDVSKQALRKQAEARLAQSPDIPESLSPDEISARLHELRVHQIELEMQNEELRTAQAEIEAGRARLFDLYDLAPVGYCTLSEQGLILEANLTVATLLGTTRSALIKQPISRCILKDDQDLYYLRRKKLFETGEPQECELRLVKPDGTGFWAHLKATAAQAEDGAPVCRVVLIDITERKQAELAQREASMRLEESIRAANVGLWDWDLATHCVHYSSEWKRQIGYDDAEISDAFEEWESRVHPEDLAPTLAKVREAIAGNNQRYQAEFRFRHKDNSYRWMVAQCSVLRAENGQALRVIGSHVDLTEFRQVETSLRASEARFRSYIEHSPYGVFVVDGQGRYVDANPAAARITGYSAGQITSMCISDMLPPENIEVGLQHFQTLLETGESFGDTAFRHADGSVRHWMVSATRLAPDRYLAFVEDITERKQTRDALRASDLRFEKLLRNVPTVAVQGYALDGTVRYWNRTSETFYGYTAEEALARNLLDLIIPPAMRDGVSAAIRRMAETGEAIPAAEVELMRKDGSPIPVYSSHALVQLPGLAPELFCIDIDLTARKHAEAEQEKLQAQLLQAQKMESVGRLAGGVAHDFNNLLMGIMNYAELCRDGVEAEHPIRPWLDEITTEAQRSANLVRQLLAFARKQLVQPKALDLNDQIEGMLKMLGRMIGERVELSWSPAAALRLVNADPSHIDQIMANLCINAADAIAGCGRVTIATRNVALDAAGCAGLPGMAPGTYVLLTVADTGCGMDADTLAHAFEPFFTTKDMGRGTGLGLATVYGIVKQSDGFIYVDSAPGAGTTFRIYLPALACAAVETESLVDAKPPPGGSETILVVDDEKSIRVSTAAHLERLGYHVLMADGPDAALRLTREHTGAIDLLLSDMVMPGMSGVELRDRLLSVCPDLKTIFITGYTTADFVEPDGKGPDFVRLAKPIPLRDLAIAIRAVLG